jgi:uridine phosphorylase
MATDPALRMNEADAPILEFDPTREAIIEAARVPYIRDAAGRGHGMPERVVLCFFQEVIATMVAEYGARRLMTLHSEIGPNEVYVLDHDGVAIALAHPGVGAPLAAGFLEELIGLGGRVFIAVGGAGTLVPDLTLGHVIVPTAAVRDEGTSYHYLPASREVEPTPRVLEAILATLTERGVPYVAGKTWTTDAIFRETRGKAARRVAEGCISVEMEAAACFAVAQFRDVAFGQLLYAGDDLSGEIWDDRGWIGHATGREAIFRLAVDAITRLSV